jgi:hypothetical protein
MQCILPHCGADSNAFSAEQASCGGRGSQTTPDGLWCVAAWLHSDMEDFPTYEAFLAERPWIQPGL